MTRFLFFVFRIKVRKTFLNEILRVIRISIVTELKFSEVNGNKKFEGRDPTYSLILQRDTITLSECFLVWSKGFV